MQDIPLEFNIFLATTAGIIALVALFSVPLKRYASSPLVATGAGILLAQVTSTGELVSGPTLLIMEEAARITLAVGLMAAALRVSRADIKSQWKPTAILLGLLMPLMWLLSSLIAYLVFSISILTAFLLGSLITPTDPVLAGSVLTGRVAEEKIPRNVRALISLESGMNDGLNYPFMFLPLLLMQHDAREAIFRWGVITWLWEVVGAIALGILIGYIAAQATCWAETHEHRGKTAVLVFSTALAFLSMAVSDLAGMDGILAIFVAGVVFDYIVEGSRAASPEEVQEAIDLLFTIPAFLLFGMALPWKAWGDLGWTAVAFPLLILAFRRFPAVAAIAPLLAKWHARPRRLLIAWAGPIGMSSVFYSAVASRLLKDDAPWVIGSLVVFSSVIVHGFGTPPVVRAFGRRAGEHRVGEEEEEQPPHEEQLPAQG